MHLCISKKRRLLPCCTGFQRCRRWRDGGEGVRSGRCSPAKGRRREEQRQSPQVNLMTDAVPPFLDPIFLCLTAQHLFQSRCFVFHYHPRAPFFQTLFFVSLCTTQPVPIVCISPPSTFFGPTVLCVFSVSPFGIHTKIATEVMVGNSGGVNHLREA